MVVGLEIEADIEVAAECDNGENAIETARDLLPDVVFSSSQIAPIGGVRVTAGICEVVPTCRVVIVIGNEGVQDAIRAVRAGAVGVVSRDDAVSRAALIARQVFSGQVILPPAVAGQLLVDLDQIARPEAGDRAHLRPPALSGRERHALEQIRDAASPDDTAAQMAVPVASVHNLARSAVAKVHRHARSEAVLYTVADKVYGF